MIQKANEYKLHQEDLIRISQIIQNYIDTEPHKSVDKYYPSILRTLARNLGENESIAIGTNRKYISIE